MSNTEIETKIQEIIATQIRPFIQRDGGDISFVKFEDGQVFVSLHGACGSCPSSTMTLKMGVEQRLREAIPEVKEVVSV